MSDVKKIIGNIDRDLWSEILGFYTDDLYGEWLILDISKDDLINMLKTLILKLIKVGEQDY